MTKKYTQDEVDKWVEDNGDYDATHLFNEMLPRHSAKLNRLDKKIRDILSEINEIFPDAQYYTASGGFTLTLGITHEGRDQKAQRQRAAWGGRASISDGDW